MHQRLNRSCLFDSVLDDFVDYRALIRHACANMSLAEALTMARFWACMILSFIGEKNSAAVENEIKKLLAEK